MQRGAASTLTSRYSPSSYLLLRHITCYTVPSTTFTSWPSIRAVEGNSAESLSYNSKNVDDLCPSLLRVVLVGVLFSCSRGNGKRLMRHERCMNVDRAQIVVTGKTPRAGLRLLIGCRQVVRQAGEK